MDDNVLVDSETMEAIADAIREKTGKTEPMYPREMAGEISGIDTSEADEADLAWLAGDVTEVVVPEGTTRIPPFMLNGDAKLVSVEFPEGLKKIGMGAFADCEQLQLEKLPDSVTTIEGGYGHQGAFCHCKNITLKELPTSLSSVGINAFAGCENIAISSFPSGLKTCGHCAFDECNKIREFVFHKDVSSTSDGLFQDCLGLIRVTFLGMGTTIHPYTFLRCNNLIKINVPWKEGEKPNAPWGAVNATINYNYNAESEDGADKN